MVIEVYQSDYKALSRVLAPFLERLSKSGWDELDKACTWNAKKPVWIRALMELLEPFLMPIFEELVDTFQLSQGRKSGGLNFQSLISEMIDGIEDILPIVPAGIMQACKIIDTKIPASVKPLAQSTLTQLIISSMYSFVSKYRTLLTSNDPKDVEKQDIVRSFGEALVNIDNNKHLLRIQRVANLTLEEEILDSVTIPERKTDEMAASHDFAGITGAITANELNSTEEGSLALRCLYRFYCYNADWIQCSVAACLSTAIIKSNDSNDDDECRQSRRFISLSLRILGDVDDVFVCNRARCVRSRHALYISNIHVSFGLC